MANRTLTLPPSVFDRKLSLGLKRAFSLDVLQMRTLRRVGVGQILPSTPELKGWAGRASPPVNLLKQLCKITTGRGYERIFYGTGCAAKQRKKTWATGVPSGTEEFMPVITG